jgi:hypothetical protein
VVHDAIGYEYIVKTNKEVAMERTRAPGAGRKPKGDYAGKAATFTTRIRPELRAALDRAAAEKERSLSQEVERRLDESFKLPAKMAKDFGPPHIAALARLVAEVGKTVEVLTGLNWRQDRFTCEAFRASVNILLDQLTPEGEVIVPGRCAETADADRSGRGYSDQMRNPDGVGAAAALGLWSQLELLEVPPLNRDDGLSSADAYYVLPQVRRDLGVPSRREKAR